jgi:hypothetical protein
VVIMVIILMPVGAMLALAGSVGAVAATPR